MISQIKDYFSSDEYLRRRTEKKAKQLKRSLERQESRIQYDLQKAEKKLALFLKKCETNLEMPERSEIERYTMPMIRLEQERKSINNELNKIVMAMTKIQMNTNASSLMEILGDINTINDRVFPSIESIVTRKKQVERDTVKQEVIDDLLLDNFNTNGLEGDSENIHGKLVEKILINALPSVPYHKPRDGSVLISEPNIHVKRSSSNSP